MNVEDIIRSGRVKVTCSRCGLKFSGRNKACPKCGREWKPEDAVGQSIMPIAPPNTSSIIRKSGKEAKEV